MHIKPNAFSVTQFKMAQEYFESAKGGFLVDVSCGSGLFSRKFAKSGTYSGVIALDFSENMLRQCYDFIKKDDTLSTTYSFFHRTLKFGFNEVYNEKFIVFSFLCLQ